MCDCCECECDCDIYDGLSDNGKKGCWLGEILCFTLSLLIMILFPISVTILKPVLQYLDNHISFIMVWNMIPIVFNLMILKYGFLEDIGLGLGILSLNFQGINK